MKHDDAMKALPPALKEAMEAKKKAADEARKAYDDAMEQAKKATKPGDDMDKAKDEDEDEVEKGLSESALNKALDVVETYLATSGPGRKQVLLEKSMSGTATVAEQAELAGILSGDTPSVVGQELAKSMEPSEDALQKGLSDGDVSGFLTELSENFQGVAYALGAELEKSAGKHDEALHMAMSGILAIGREVQALRQDLAKSVRGEPAAENLATRVPVSAPKGQQLEKSDPGATKKVIGPEQVHYAMTTLLQDSLKKGFDGKSPYHANLRYDVEASKYEQSGMLSPAMEKEVRAFFKTLG